MVLMVVRVIIGPLTVAPRAGALSTQAPRALSAAQSHERNVGRHVHARHRLDRQRLGPLMSAARKQQTGKSHRGKAE
jgi:hypothetical protein